MKRIEQLMDIGKNKDRFLFLTESINKNRLVVFFGAGLSLWRSYRTWGYPFKWVEKRVEKKFKDLKKYYNEFKEGISPETNERINKISDQITKGKEHKKNNAFLEWGDTLNKAISTMSEAFNNSGLSGEFNVSSFNEYCIQAFQAYKKLPIPTAPYQIPAIYFLPYLSSFIITTNVDSSFVEVCKKTGTKSWDQKAIKPEDSFDPNKWNFPSHFILYIHGHIKEPGSLIMTASDYDKMYPKNISTFGEHRGAREVLNKVVKGYTVLFLGASLQTDRTVEIINHEYIKAIKSRKRKKLHFIPMTMQEGGDLCEPPQITDVEPLVYSKGVYGEIPILLLHLIRETTTRNDYCTWQKPKRANYHISEETQNKINRSLKENITIEGIDLENEEPIDIVQYLFDHHSILNHDSGLGWSICHITHRNFSLEGFQKDKEPFCPLHNYPIGDTIYVLSDNRDLFRNEEVDIVLQICQWHEAHFPLTRESDPTDDNKMIPRIRIIRIQAKYIETYNKYLDPIVAKKELLPAAGEQDLRTLESSRFANLTNLTIEELIHFTLKETSRENTMETSEEDIIDDVPTLTLKPSVLDQPNNKLR